MKVALVYDRVNKWGGAERILLGLNKIFPDATLYTSVLNLDKAPWARTFKEIKTSFIQDFPASSFHEGYAALMPLGFENLSFDNYNLVISVTSEAAKGIITKPQTKHICICLTPTRYLWSGYDDYFKNPIFKIVSKPVVSYLRTWDKIASYRPDSYIAISREVKNRIRKYYGRDSKIIYPPLGLTLNYSQRKYSGEPYFLVVSRLVPYKRIDLAIKACNKLNLPLKIVGTGSDFLKLKIIAGKRVEFLGKLTDEELSYYYKNCKALIFPGMEDFGLVMVEAQSLGIPVIAYKGGGAIEIIKSGVTGEFFNKMDARSLEEVLANFNPARYNSALCIANAQKFSFENFKRNLLELVEKL